SQVQHLVACAREPKITVRVLPVDAAIDGYVIPRSAFSVYAYSDLRDPRVVAVDTVTTDVVLTSLTEETQVTRYINLYERLLRASLTPRKSVELLKRVAAELTGK
ncbi:MAG: Scr1 family TA system antitoxin-like transcriptional regulator, partial [Nocardioidaceae bacterium]